MVNEIVEKALNTVRMSPVFDVADIILDENSLQDRNIVVFVFKSRSSTKSETVTKVFDKMDFTVDTLNSWLNRIEKEVQAISAINKDVSNSDCGMDITYRCSHTDSTYIDSWSSNEVIVALSNSAVNNIIDQGNDVNKQFGKYKNIIDFVKHFNKSEFHNSIRAQILDVETCKGTIEALKENMMTFKDVCEKIIKHNVPGSAEAILNYAVSIDDLNIVGIAKANVDYTKKEVNITMRDTFDANSGTDIKDTTNIQHSLSNYMIEKIKSELHWV